MDEQKKARMIMRQKDVLSALHTFPSMPKYVLHVKKKVGNVNKHGIAKKPFDWLAYTICLIAWMGFGFYIWWCFFKN